MDVDVFLDLNDIALRDLGIQQVANRRQELRVEVEPEVRLLEDGIHAREG
jgi:hypothetical protein